MQQHFVSTDNYTWLHLYNPSPDTIQKLHREHDFHELILEDLLVQSNEPTVNTYNDVMAMTINFSKYDIKLHKHLVNSFHFVLTKSNIITTSKYNSKRITQLVDEAKEDKLDIEDIDTTFDVLYGVMDRMYDKTIGNVQKIDQEVVTLQGKLYKQQSNPQYLRDLLSIKIDLVTLQHIFSAHKHILRDLPKACHELYGDMQKRQAYELYIEDLMTKLDKILSTLRFLVEIVQSLTDTYNTMLSLTTNTTITRLTVFSVITGVMTIIVGAYGMNVSLPGGLVGEGNIWTFWIICASMVLISGGLFIFFKRKALFQ